MGVGTSFGKMRALPMLPFLSDIETLYGAVVAHHPGVNQTFVTFFLILLQYQVMLLLYIHHILNFDKLLKSSHRISGNTYARHRDTRV